MTYAFVLVLLGIICSGCVTRVQVCTTYDHRLGRDAYARDGAGASVCADVEPVPQ